MKKIIIKEQSDIEMLKKLEKRTDVIIDAIEPIYISDYFYLFFTLKNRSVVHFLKGVDHVELKDRSTAHVFYRGNVETKGKSRAFLHGSSKAFAMYNSKIHMFDYSEAEIHDNVKAFIFSKNCSIEDYDDSIIKKLY